MATTSDQDLSPAEIEQAEFPTAARGYNKEAVRRYLSRLADALEHQQSTTALSELESNSASQDRVDELEDEVTRLTTEVGRLEGNLADERSQIRELKSARSRSTRSNTASLEGLDEGQLIELLGQETARVLESARAAAADIQVRAEAKASETEREAQDALIKSRREARALVSKKKAEADELVAKVTAEAEKRSKRMSDEARRLRDEAAEESERIVAEAEGQVEAEEKAAKERAAQIVADAESLRLQVLSELVVERGRIRTELNGAAATRDRLTLALGVARSELEAMITELGTDGPDPDQIEDADGDDADTEAQVQALIAELEERRSTDPDPDPAPETESSSPSTKASTKTSAKKTGSKKATKRSSKTATKTRSRAKAEAKPAKAKSTSTRIPVDRLSVDEADGMKTLEFDDQVELDLELDLDVEESDGEAATETIDLEKNGLIDGFHTINLDDDTDLDNPVDLESTVDLDESDDDSIDGGEASGFGDDDDTTTFDDPDDDDTVIDLTDGEADHVITTVAARQAASKTERSIGDLLVEAPFTGRLPAQFKARDVALTKYGPNFRRHLRRALNDDQSEVLDRLRGGRGKIKVDELPDADDQTARYLEPIRDGLTELARAGLRAGGGRRLPERAIDNLVSQLAAYIVEVVRNATIEAIDTLEGTDRERLMEPIRAHYREFRNTALIELADDALYEAFAIGLFGSIPTGVEVRWAVDPRSDPDPVCEINAAREELRKGEEFPSGHARPLALARCRCLVVQL